jgi:hypothetical protein
MSFERISFQIIQWTMIACLVAVCVRILIEHLGIRWDIRGQNRTRQNRRRSKR